MTNSNTTNLSVPLSNSISHPLESANACITANTQAILDNSNISINIPDQNYIKSGLSYLTDVNGDGLINSTDTSILTLNSSIGSSDFSFTPFYTILGLTGTTLVLSGNWFRDKGLSVSSPILATQHAAMLKPGDTFFLQNNSIRSFFTIRKVWIQNEGVTGTEKTLIDFGNSRCSIPSIAPFFTSGTTGSTSTISSNTFIGLSRKVNYSEDTISLLDSISVIVNHSIGSTYSVVVNWLADSSVKVSRIRWRILPSYTNQTSLWQYSSIMSINTLIIPSLIKSNIYELQILVSPDALFRGSQQYSDSYVFSYTT